jgi:DNA-binding MarR family transcriptional regulator
MKKCDICMGNLSEIQKIIVKNASKDPVHRGILRRSVKLDAEDLRVTKMSFNSQFNHLIEKGLIERSHGEYYKISKPAENIFT